MQFRMIFIHLSLWIVTQSKNATDCTIILTGSSRCNIHESTNSIPNTWHSLVCKRIELQNGHKRKKSLWFDTLITLNRTKIQLTTKNTSLQKMPQNPPENAWLSWTDADMNLATQKFSNLKELHKFYVYLRSTYPPHISTAGNRVFV